MKINIYTPLWILFIVAVYFTVFLHLDNIGVHRWDESRNAVNAFEMLENHNFLVRHFLGEPDHWEAKPPMLIWLQVFFIKILGYSELALRLPSALAALATIMLVLWFFHKHLNDLLGGVFASLALICSEGYIRQHVVRTGDHDALLIFFLVAFLISFFLFLHAKSDREKNKILIISALSVVFGVLTKSITGFFFMPGAILYLIISGNLTGVLKNWRVYIASGLALLIIGSYYFLRERQDPGYLYWVTQIELLPRYLNNSKQLQYHEAPSRLYYINLIIKEHFRYLCLVAPLALLTVFYSENKQKNQFILLISITLLLFLLAISFGSINSWYDAPAMPLIAILVGSVFSHIIYRIFKRFKIETVNKKAVLVFLFSLVVFSIPYAKVFQNQVYLPKYSTPDMKYGDFLKRLKKDRPEIKKMFIYFECGNAHVVYYLNVYDKKYGYKINNCGPCNSIRECHNGPGADEHVMICRPEYINEFNELFEAVEEASFHECRLYKVKKLKQNLSGL